MRLWRPTLFRAHTLIPAPCQTLCQRWSALTLTSLSALRTASCTPANSRLHSNVRGAACRYSRHRTAGSLATTASAKAPQVLFYLLVQLVADRTATAPQSTPPRHFLDLFVGSNAPLTTAMEALHVDCMQPFDLDADTACNIDDAQYRLLLRIASSGILGALWSAPPCKEFSRLKLRKPGPKALRTPEFMDGVPDNSPAEQAKVDESTEIHKRSRQIIRTARQASIHTGMEQPPSSMAWLQPDNVTLFARALRPLRACRSMPSRSGPVQVLGTLRLLSLHSLTGTHMHAPARNA